VMLSLYQDNKIMIKVFWVFTTMTKLSNFSGLYYDNKVIIFNLQGLCNY
jgi:hypothetical protein